MKKIKEMNTNLVVVMATIFITIYSTIGNGLANAFFQMDSTYLYGSIIGWAFQFFWAVVVFTLVMMIMKLISMVRNKLSRGKGGDEKDRKVKEGGEKNGRKFKAFKK